MITIVGKSGKLLMGWSCLVALPLAACANPPAAPTFHMDMGGAFYDAPFPAEGRDVAGFPNPDGVPLVEQLRELLLSAEGFGRSSAVFFSAERGIAPESLPDILGSLSDDSPVYLIDIDPRSDERGRRFPVEVAALPDGGPFGADNLLVLLPVQGVPLRSDTRYAAVISRGVETLAGVDFGPAPAVQALLAGELPGGFDPAFADAAEALVSLGQDPDSLLAFTVFTTGSPERELTLLRALAPTPRVVTDPALTEVYEGYCVYEGLLEMPVYQQGEAPYLTEGGGIAFVDGVAEVDHWEPSRIVVTLPRSPARAFPTAVFIRTGGGGDRPLVDRGVHAEAGGAAEPGSGPATWISAARYAGVSVDGPHGGLRNVSGGDEQFLMFNISNPTALRDNVRQSALEIAILPDLLGGLQIDAFDCPGLEQIATLGAPLALIGHSMGATIAPLSLAVAPQYEVVVLSGAGGSWIENVVYKEKPLEVRPLAEAMLGYDAGELTVYDPVLSLLQWAGESADPPIYREGVLETDRDILMTQGIVDHYILPPIANAMSLSLGLDLAGDSLDAATPALDGMTPLAELLPLTDGQVIAYPAGPNRGAHTRLVTQHPEDGVEDGHEVLFQTSAPQCQAQALLERWGEGAVVEACR